MLDHRDRGISQHHKRPLVLHEHDSMLGSVFESMCFFWFCLTPTIISQSHLKVEGITKKKTVEHRNQLTSKFLFYVCYLITITSNSTSSKPNKQMTQVMEPSQSFPIQLPIGSRSQSPLPHTLKHLTSYPLPSPGSVSPSPVPHNLCEAFRSSEEQVLTIPTLYVSVHWASTRDTGARSIFF